MRFRSQYCARKRVRNQPTTALWLDAARSTPVKSMRGHYTSTAASCHLRTADNRVMAIFSDGRRCFCFPNRLDKISTRPTSWRARLTPTKYYNFLSKMNKKRKYAAMDNKRHAVGAKPKSPLWRAIISAEIIKTPYIANIVRLATYHAICFGIFSSLIWTLVISTKINILPAIIIASSIMMYAKIALSGRLSKIIFCTIKRS